MNETRRQVPGVLWLLPLLFGFTGGLIAALVASLKYRASWWELFVVGVMMSVITWALWVAWLSVVL